MDNKTDVIKKHQRKEGDTGSPEVQIALLTDRITNLTNHLKANKQDNHSRRGLLLMVSRRKRLLKYLEQTDIEKYRQVKKDLNIR